MFETENVRSWTMASSGWEWRELPRPAWGELIVGVRSMLLLPQDLAALHRGDVPHPRALVGDVLESGEEANFHPGMRIFPSWRASCGLCEACQRGNETLCPDWEKERIEPIGPCDRLLLPAWNVRRASVGLSLTESPEGQVFLQPLATAVRALRRANPALSLRVVVWGNGPMARLWGMLLELRYPGARRALLSEQEECGLSEHGFHGHATCPDSIPLLLDGRPDLVIVLDPQPVRLVAAFELVCPGGIVVAFGEPEGDMALGLRAFHLEEKRLVSSKDAGPRDFKAAIAVMQPLMERLTRLAPVSLQLQPGEPLPSLDSLVAFLRIDWVSKLT